HCEGLVVWKVSRLGPPRAPMGEGRIEHRAEDDDADDDAHREAQVMESLDAPADFGHAFAHVEGGSSANVGDYPQQALPGPPAERVASPQPHLPGGAHWWHGKPHTTSSSSRVGRVNVSDATV